MQSIPIIENEDTLSLCEQSQGSIGYIIRQALETYGPAGSLVGKALLPVADKRAKRFLKRSGNPFFPEIEACANAYEAPGLYAFNLSYEWGCTSGAFLKADGSPLMLRVLDWPCNGPGEEVRMLRRFAVPGPYYDLTWPGMSSVFQAVSKGRFAAAVNLAPMRRHGNIQALDWLKNHRAAFNSGGMPPGHALRLVFERAENYRTAKSMLQDIPLCVPAIFTLTGTKPGEGCVIERLETDFAVREARSGGKAVATNIFKSDLKDSSKGWTAREPDNKGRELRMQPMSAEHLDFKSFDFLTSPIINPMTRLIMIADAATGEISARGMESYGIATSLLTYRIPS